MADGMVAAVLPASRSVEVGSLATAFVTMINTGSTAATGCGPSLPSGVAAAFSFQATNPATNQISGAVNQTVGIAAGAAQTFVISLRPTATFAETNIALGYGCSTGQSAAAIDGVSTFRLTASSVPIPDVVVLTATVSNDGIVRTPGAAGATAFSAAVVNFGASGTVTASVAAGGARLPANFAICQTNPSTGACLATPAATATATFNAQQTGTFAIFVTPTGTTIPLDPANSRVFIRFRDANGVTVGSSSVAIATQSEVSTGGGTLVFSETTITIPETAATNVLSFAVASTPAPAVPTGTVSAGNSFSVAVNDGLLLNQPVTMTIGYADDVADPAQLLVLHNPSGSTTKGDVVTLHGVDTVNRRITFDTRDFSVFAVVRDVLGLPDTYAVSGFDITRHVWPMINFGSYFMPNGNCLGMAAYTQYYFDAGAQLALRSAFQAPAGGSCSDTGGTGGDPTATSCLLASRAMLAQSQTWASLQFNVTLSQSATLIKRAIQLTQSPVVILLRDAQGGSGHAINAYGWNERGLLVYNNNNLATQEVIPVNADGSFGSYSSGGFTWTKFGFLGFPSLGRRGDFAGLTAEARAGFTSSRDIAVSTPAQNASLTTRQVVMSGTYGGSIPAPAQVRYYLNGAQGALATVAGTSFNAELPLTNGRNTLIITAGQTAASTWQPGAGTLVRTFNASFTPVVFRATLAWTDSASDIDLYVLQPNGQASWYASRTTSQGLSLDFDNTSGLGPENITLSSTGTVLPGSYRIRVHAYRIRGSARAISGNVTMVLNEGTATATPPLTFPWTLSTSSTTNDSPTAAGGDWVDIATVDLVNGTISR